MDPRAVVLVEGVSDQRALEALARRRGRDLVAEGVSIVAIEGSKNIGRALERFGPAGLGLTLAGLYDAGEVRDFQRGLEGAGLGSDLTPEGMERLGFYACVQDIEDELIRAVGTEAVERCSRARESSTRSERSSGNPPGGTARRTNSSDASSERKGAPDLLGAAAGGSARSERRPESPRPSPHARVRRHLNERTSFEPFRDFVRGSCCAFFAVVDDVAFQRSEVVEAVPELLDDRRIAQAIDSPLLGSM